MRDGRVSEAEAEMIQPRVYAGWEKKQSHEQFESLREKEEGRL